MLRAEFNSLLGLAAVLWLPSAHALDFLVPAYIYPVPTDLSWSTLGSTTAEVDVTAILNPGNGPGNSVDANYTAAVDGLKAAGGNVIGYVYTQYGTRDISEVKTDIDRHISFYGVNGFFVDEVSNQASDLAYYKSLYDYIKGKSAGYTVVGNPGTNTLEGYLAAADVLITFEGTQASHERYAPDAWTGNYSADRFAHLVYDVPNDSSMSTVVDRAVSQNVGHIYVTDQSGANPWGALPAYWPDEVAHVASVPEAETWTLMLMGLGLVAWTAGRKTAN